MSKDSNASSRSEKELLEKLRGHLAYSKQCAPYLIFRDEELKLLLQHRPQNLEELSKLKGFPKDGKRVAGWGSSIVDIFTRAEKIADFKVKLVDGEPVSHTELKRMTAF